MLPSRIYRKYQYKAVKSARKTKITDHFGNTMYPLYRKLADQAQERTDILAWK